MRGMRPAMTTSLSFNCAAPFRERLFLVTRLHRLTFANPSIVPLPFGSGYVLAAGVVCYSATAFNCAAPFRERLFQDAVAVARERATFNCAAPFRERL